VRKTVWISFGVALVLVNLFAWLAQQFTGFNIPMILRLTLVLGITVGTIVFSGAFALLDKLDQEKPLTGHGHDTLQQRPGASPHKPVEPDSRTD